MALTPQQQQNLADQELTVLGLQPGTFYGISAAIDGSINTQLDITIAGYAVALLNDGTVLSAAAPAVPVPVASVGAQSVALVSTTIGNLTANGTYYLWLDHSTDGLNSPVWSVAAGNASPSVNAIPIARVVVAGNVLSAVTPLAIGSGTSAITAAWSYADTTARAFGILPANSVIDKIVTYVGTASNAGTTGTLSVGKSSGTGHDYLNGVDVKSNAGEVAPGTAAVGYGSVGTSAVTLTLTYAQTGTGATAGSGQVTVFYHQG